MKTKNAEVEISMYTNNGFYGHIYVTIKFLDANNIHRIFLAFCQYDKERGKKAYAFKCKSGKEITIENFTSVSKFLSPISKAYQKIVEEWGEPETFNKFVLYSMKAMGIKKFTDKDTESTHKVTDIIDLIDETTKKLYESMGI